MSGLGRVLGPCALLYGFEHHRAQQEHADEAQKSSLIIDNNFTPVEYDPQYILQVNHLTTMV